ncbi:ThiF family adenylyltransferase [Rhodococcus sp. 3Y1]
MGTIGIAEFDEVDMSNLQRQVIHGRSDVGRPKALSAKESILEINEHVDVRLHEFRLDNSNAVELFSEYDLILDGTDNFATRYLVNDAAVIAGKPYVGLDLPLRRAGLGLLGRRPGRRGTELSRSLPGGAAARHGPSCAEGGVLGVLPATVGSIMATEAVKLITGIGEPLGRLMIYDALAMTFRTIRLQRDPTRVPVTALIDYDAFCGVVSEEASAAAVGSTITAPELEAMIGEGRSIELVDVREPVEWDIMHLPGPC